MFTTSTGEELFVIDGHVALWDGSPANQRNRHGAEFISCFYDYHRSLSPPDYVWPRDKYEKYDADTFCHDLFDVGYVDMAIMQPVFLGDFYINGFGSMARNWELIQRFPNRLIGNGYWDPRDGEPGLVTLEEAAAKYHLKGVKLYTAEWHGDSKGYKLSDPWAKAYLQKCQDLGIRNIHVHKGPTIRPLNRDAFDVADIDDAATSFPDLNFIVEHCGLPRLEDFCWIAVQEPNVYAGLAVANAFIHTRPHYFGEIMGELLYWLGEDRIIFGSDYALWHPKWLLEEFMAFELPDDVQKEIGRGLTLGAKKKILAENIAKLYDINIEQQKERLGLHAPVPAGAEGSPGKLYDTGTVSRFS